ncbi:MAG: [Fe-Fe] hydrogenase large subunit C-terminal domain-containing protein [Armatimonadota bacterium]|jgi:signal transduction histidine kinase/iron only hydrogenase large subunit-like protein
MSGVVATIGEKCRRCYTCVRHCPAKAIKVQDGQAKVLPERCIGCGNCIRVCSQGAKTVDSQALPMTQQMIADGEHVVACLAPSFPVAFPRIMPRQLISALRHLGFSGVMEVAVGAELVSRAYRRLVEEHPERRPLITTPCPALVSYVERYLPELLPALAPIVSPMIALGRLVKQRLRPEAKVVFIGPCVAKKSEARDPSVAGAVDAVMTFKELSDWLAEAGMDPSALPEGEFDGPLPDVGRIFPVSGGLLRTAMLSSDVLSNDIVVTEGVDRTTELLRAMGENGVGPQFFDLLFCEGCIKGPFAGDHRNTVSLKQTVATYTAEEAARRPGTPLSEYDDLDLSRAFSNELIPAPQPGEEEIRAILRQTNKVKPEDELNCGACGYPSCRDKAIAVYNGLAEAEMCLPYLIDKLQQTIAELNTSRRELLEAEEQLIHSEKLASMGQLAAGVAHEINNPLGTVLIYSHMLLKELPGEDPRRDDLEMITREADRCRNIVAGLLDFSRQNKPRNDFTNVNELLTETLALLEKQEQLQGMRIETQLEPDLPNTVLDSDQMKQAFINVFKNAAEAMPEGGSLRVGTVLSENGTSISIRFSDTGCGIPEENLERIFHPFFTTKQIGKGTGLGLAIVYGIVKMHRGSISVDSKVGVGSTFTITLPVVAPGEASGY